MDLLMKEVEDEISRINTKYKKNTQKVENNFCNEENIETCVQFLAEELENFDVFHISDFKSDENNENSMKTLIVQLVNSNYDLIQKHKEILKQQKDSFEKNARILSDVNRLNKTVNILRKELNLKETQLQLNKDKVVLGKLENKELQTKITHTKKELNGIQRVNVSQIEKHKHEIQKVLLNSKKLEDRFRQNCGKFVSQDSYAVSIIENYKQNEDKYISLIEQLKKNNQELVEEILHHRGNVNLE